MLLLSVGVGLVSVGRSMRDGVSSVLQPCEQLIQFAAKEKESYVHLHYWVQ